MTRIFFIYILCLFGFLNSSFAANELNLDMLDGLPVDPHPANHDLTNYSTGDFSNMDTTTLAEAIRQRREDLLLKKFDEGDMSAIGGQVGIVSNYGSTNSDVITPLRSARRLHSTSRQVFSPLRLATSNGEKFRVCKDGIIQLGIVSAKEVARRINQDPHLNIKSKIDLHSNKNYILVICGAEKDFSKKAQDLPLDSYYQDLRARDYQFDHPRADLYKFRGITNAAIYFYEINDPDKRQGCGTEDGINAMLEQVQQSEIGQRNFDGIAADSWQEILFRACTDTVRYHPILNVPSILGINDKFKREARKALGNRVKFYEEKGGYGGKDKTSVPIARRNTIPESDVFGDGNDFELGTFNKNKRGE